MYVSVYMCVYVCAYVYVSVYTYVCTCVCVCIYLLDGQQDGRRWMYVPLQRGQVYDHYKWKIIKKFLPQGFGTWFYTLFEQQ